MKLHENKTLYKEAILFTAQQMNLPPEFIEKDYWVTYALCLIYKHEIGKETVFKGGTALSKCYRLIERFSEDIDLVVIRRTGESNNKLTTKIRMITDVVGAVLPEIELEGITHKRGMIRKTAHLYNKDFKEYYEQVRDIIVLEATWFGHSEPFIIKSINSFIGQMLLKNDQLDIASEYQLLPFEVSVLNPVRTICEKIMSLVRFSYSENPIDDLKRKIRHVYDLHKLLQVEDLSAFFKSVAFEEMLLKVANDDAISFKNNNYWLNHHPSESLILKELPDIWAELRTVYTGNFKNLVYGELPEENAILKTLESIKERIKNIDWTVKTV